MSKLSEKCLEAIEKHNYGHQILTKDIRSLCHEVAEREAIIKDLQDQLASLLTSVYGVKITGIDELEKAKRSASVILSNSYVRLGKEKEPVSVTT
jgi:hypothetical protein